MSVRSLPRAQLCALLASAFVLAGCRYRPARFADHPEVVKVGDDMAIPVPARNDFDEILHVSDIYLRRPLFDALSPVEPPDAADVSSMDEVPASSWYRPPRQLSEILADPEVPLGGPPEPPFAIVDDPPSLGSVGTRIAIVDRRGVRYELARDTERRPELLTGAAVVGSRLLRGLGYRTPDVFLLDLAPADVGLDHPVPTAPAPGEEPLPTPPTDEQRAQRARRVAAHFAGGAPAREGRYRVSATRWPIGIDVGITPDFGTRGDDNNDLIAHHDRRTLRALSVFGSFLAFDGFGVRRTRDVYVGERGKGFLRHYVVSMERSLGATSVVDPLPAYRPLDGPRGEGTLANLLLLGFAPAARPVATQRKFLGLGTIGPLANPKGLDTALPYGPFVRLTRADGYWAAKRIQALLATPSTLEAIVDAGRYSEPGARDELLFLLRLRGRQVVGHWLHRTTPIEILGTEDKRLVLRDEAIAGGYAPAAEVTYEISYVDGEGRKLGDAQRLAATSDRFTLTVPPAVIDPKRNAVLHVRSFRRGVPAPMWCDVHLAFYVGGVRAYAISH